MVAAYDAVGNEGAPLAHDRQALEGVKAGGQGQELPHGPDVQQEPEEGGHRDDLPDRDHVAGEAIAVLEVQVRRQPCLPDRCPLRRNAG